jgi:membrane protease subunit HflC
MKRNPITITTALLLLVIFFVLLFTFQVRQSEVAVVTTFGRVTSYITNAGPNLRLPPPIQVVHKFDQRVQNFTDQPTEGLTRDGFNLITSVYVGWRITEPTNFFPRFAGSANPIMEAEKSLESLLGNAKSAVVGKHPMSDFVSATDNGTNFLAIENEIFAAIQNSVQSNSYGLSVEFLGIKKLQLPESVSQSVFEQMTSERQKLAAKSQAEGDAEADKIRSGAQRRAAEMLAGAEGTATEIKGKAEGEAAKSLAVFQQNPDLANFIFRLNALDGALKERSILIFDQNTPPFDVFRNGGVTTNMFRK